MNKIIPSLLAIFAVLFLSACKYDSAAPIHDIRFDPKLLGRVQTDGPATCANHNFYEKDVLKNLGTISSEYVLVAFNPSLSNESRQQVVESFGFVESIVSQASSRSSMLYTIRLMDGLNCQQAEQAIKEISKNNSVDYVAPYFLRVVNGQQQLTGVSNELVVKVRGNEATVLKQLSKAYNADLVSESGSNAYLLKVDKHSKGNALDAANFFKSKKAIELATPEFVVTPL